MTTTKTEKDTPTPQEAEAELRKAEQHFSDLEARLLEGDTSVRQSDFSSASSRLEYLSKMLEGAKSVAVREAKADKEERGRQLHREFVADASALIAQTNESLIEAGKTFNVALDYLDQMKDLKDAYQNKVNGIFGGDMENPVALMWKFNHQPGGSFGALDESHIVPRPNPVETILAVFGEALRGRDHSRRTGPDAKWWGQLKAPQLASGLRDLRALAEFVEAQEGQEDND